MSEVKRYNPEYESRNWGHTINVFMEETDSGEYVPYSDYAKLESLAKELARTLENCAPYGDADLFKRARAFGLLPWAS